MSISREDYLDIDPYGDKEAEREEARDKADFLADRKREDEMLRKVNENNT